MGYILFINILNVYNNEKNNLFIKSIFSNNLKKNLVINKFNLN